MKIRCDRNSLVESLNSIHGIIPQTSPKPILMDFFLSTHDGSLVVEATDLEISGRVTVHKVEVLEEGHVALPSARLLSIVKEIPEDLVSINTIDDPLGAIIESGGFEFRILGHDPAEFPTVAEPETITSIPIGREKLYTSLKRVSVAASRDTTRYQLNGVFLEFEKDKLTLTATDGKRLTHDSFKVEGPESGSISAILPNQAIDVFLKVLSSHTMQDDTVTLSLSETHVALKTTDNQICSTLVDGIFPNYRSVFPPEPKVKIKGRRSAMLSAARSASLTTDKQTSTVAFRVTPESLVLESNAKDIGQSRIEIGVDVSGDPIEMRFNPFYFIDALRTFEDDEVTLEMTDAARPAILRSSSSYRHLVMPLVNN